MHTALFFEIDKCLDLVTESVVLKRRSNERTVGEELLPPPELKLTAQFNVHVMEAVQSPTRARHLVATGLRIQELCDSFSNFIKST